MKLTVEVLKDLGCYPDSDKNPQTWFLQVSDIMFEITLFPHRPKAEVRVYRETGYAEIDTVEGLISHAYGWGRTMERREVSEEVKGFLLNTCGININA